MLSKLQPVWEQVRSQRALAVLPLSASRLVPPLSGSRGAAVPRTPRAAHRHGSWESVCSVRGSLEAACSPCSRAPRAGAAFPCAMARRLRWQRHLVLRSPSEMPQRRYGSETPVSSSAFHAPYEISLSSLHQTVRG